MQDFPILPWFSSCQEWGEQAAIHLRKYNAGIMGVLFAYIILGQKLLKAFVFDVVILTIVWSVEPM